MYGYVFGFGFGWVGGDGRVGLSLAGVIFEGYDTPGCRLGDAGDKIEVTLSSHALEGH